MSILKEIFLSLIFAGFLGIIVYLLFSSSSLAKASGLIFFLGILFFLSLWRLGEIRKGEFK